MGDHGAFGKTYTVFNLFGVVMTDKVLVNFLAECERIVNGRPLVPVTSDCRDLPVLILNDLFIMRDNSCEIPAFK